MQSRSLVFSEMVRRVGVEARRHGLAMPAFRAPPPAGLDRSLRRRESGVVVSVRIMDREWVQVADDIAAGVLAANRADDVETAAALSRAALLAAPDTAAA